MTIRTESHDGSSFTVKFPNWILLNRLGIGIALKSIARRSKKYTGGEKNDEYMNKEAYSAEGKTEDRLAAKKLKKALGPVIGELRAFLKRHPDFVLLEAQDSDGDTTTITL